MGTRPPRLGTPPPPCESCGNRPATTQRRGGRLCAGCARMIDQDGHRLADCPWSVHGGGPCTCGHAEKSHEMRGAYPNERGYCRTCGDEHVYYPRAEARRDREDTPDEDNR